MSDEWRGMPSDPQTSLLARLHRVEGQVRGLARMIEEDRYCLDVLTQFAATTRALQAVALELLEDHLRACVVTALHGGDVERKMAEIRTAVARLAGS
jgi:CsoR family transcriptional regulator, copper-sensing transcriptional repressor